MEKQREQLELMSEFFFSFFREQTRKKKLFKSLDYAISIYFLSIASSDIDLKSTLEQVERQRKQIAKYETDRVQFKARIKELSEELVVLQSANRETQASDEDSPDQMSELDRQQELLSKMSAKNKHISRLLKDIEVRELLSGGAQSTHKFTSPFPLY